MSIAATTDLEHASTRLLLVPLTSTITCVGLADWLFFGWQIGISLALFLGVLGLVAVATNRTYAPRRVQIAMSVVFVAVLVALVEDISILSAMLGALGTGAFVMEITAREPARWQQCLLEVVVAPFLGPFQFAGDLIWQIRKTNYAWLKLDSLIAWIVPLGIFAVFVWLFATANPLIEHGLLQINPSTLLDLLDPRRMAFWMLLAGVIWPFIFRRNGRISAPKAEVHAEAETAGGPSELGHFLGVSATLRSLILFNALFALQTVLDLTYLWGGASLPNGMSHAEYAHRGAYPLIATALLAAASVLVAMRPGGPAENSRLIRPLVLAWIAQNVLLVISSIFRLDLYVAAYSLTYLRLAALIWMVLVAIGLVLILIQIIRKKSNSWLLAANAISLALVLYACCFLNAPWLIATYNIEHSREISGTGPKLDLWYLVSLGPQAEPALRSHLAEMPGLEPYIQEIRCHRDNSFEYCNYDRQRPENWRAWSFRTWRLERFLANNPLAMPWDHSRDDKG